MQTVASMAAPCVVPRSVIKSFNQEEPLAIVGDDEKELPGRLGVGRRRVPSILRWEAVMRTLHPNGSAVRVMTAEVRRTKQCYRVC
jgi:hypothetical protein